MTGRLENVPKDRGISIPPGFSKGLTSLLFLLVFQILQYLSAIYVFLKYVIWGKLTKKLYSNVSKLTFVHCVIKRIGMCAYNTLIRGFPSSILRYQCTYVHSTVLKEAAAVCSWIKNECKSFQLNTVGAVLTSHPSVFHKPKVMIKCCSHGWRDWSN